MIPHFEIYVAAGVVIALTAISVGLYEPLERRMTVLGMTRKGVHNVHGSTSLVQIPNTVHCEDLHHHIASNTLFTACQSDPIARYQWFPPLTIFSNPDAIDQGHLMTIDPDTLQPTDLDLVGFSGSFVTHGIDVVSTEPGFVKIFAVNHAPNPDHYSPDAPALHRGHKAHSVIEVFMHELGTSQAHHLRTIAHPRIATPNDIYAIDPDNFLVTNDHSAREGHLRMLADVSGHGYFRTDTLHVSITDSTARDPDKGIAVHTALNALNNNNGLGHVNGRPDEVLIGCAVLGRVTRAVRSGTKLKVLEHVNVASTIDNPVWYDDPYAMPGNNASGYVLAGLARAAEMAGAVETQGPIPSIVWHVRADGHDDEAQDRWEKRLIFMDDGKSVSGVATALLVGINPRKNGGKKQARLFITGFLTDAVTVATVDV